MAYGRRSFENTASRAKFIFFMFALLMVYAMISAISQNQTANKPSKKPAKLAPGATTPQKPVVATTSHNWPPPARDKAEMAQDLLAKNYLVIFDGSGSMTETKCSGSLTKIQAARKAVIEFLDSLDPAANAGLVAFGKSSGKTITSRHKFVSADKEGIKRIMHEMVASGNTPLVRSMGMGFEMLQEQAQRQGGYGEYHMVIVTDGEASDGNPANMARKIVLSSPVIINAIGFCLNGKHSLDVDGYTKFSVANDPAALSAGLKGVLAESESFDTDTFVVQ